MSLLKSEDRTELADRFTRAATILEQRNCTEEARALKRTVGAIKFGNVRGFQLTEAHRLTRTARE